MAHNHHSCGDEHHHDHDHHEEANERGFQDNLYTHINKTNVVALNSTGKGNEVIKPWNERLDEQKYLESDADDQM